ncbi:RNA polymerase subunit sigma-70, partial [Bradyrhizobium sp. Leo170]
RVQGSREAADGDAPRQRRIVEAFLAASRDGDFEGLLAVLDPGVVFRADAAAQRLGSLAEIRGATAVAETFKGRAQAAKPALVDGAPALAVILDGQLRIVLQFTIAGDRITAFEAVANAEPIAAFDIEMPPSN